MQIESFKTLLEKYKDYATSPAAEPLEAVQNRFNQPFTDYYFILDEKITVGAVRVARINESTCRVSHIFILPRFQNRGYAQETLREVEKLYPNANEWRLDTIKEESKLKYLYEKSGYTPTGVEEKIKDGMTIVYYSKNVTL